MDIGYIILNTIIYGCCALILADMFSYGRIFNFALGSYIMFSGYIIFNCIKNGFTTLNICAITVLLISFFVIDYLLIKKFPNKKKREHASLIVTLGVSLFLDNFCNFIYGGRGVSIPSQKISIFTLILCFLLIFFVFFYVHNISYYSKVLDAISENEGIVSGLGINKNRIIGVLYGILFVLILLLGYILITNSSIKMQSGLFYIIKGMGIMILVGLSKKEWIFLGALLYVMLEYILFNKLGLPIGYKETVILICIVLILLFKPEGLFALRNRKI